MKRKVVRIILLIIGIGIIASVITFLWVFRESPDSVASKKPDISVDANTLIEAYENDESAANTEYLDKIILLKGIIRSVAEKDQELTVLLEVPGKLSGILCSFTKGTVDKNLLKQGSEIKVKGICTGYLMDVVLSKCALSE